MREAAPTAEKARSARPFDIRPLMFEAFSCTAAMMAFVALAGPICRALGLDSWQAGAAVSVGGIAWMLSAYLWGAASDRWGRKAINLAGLTGFSICFAGLALFVEVAMRAEFAATAVFVGLIVCRGLMGAFYAAVPPTAAAMIADHIPAERRAGAMATLGAATGVGMVVGPALAGALGSLGIALPLFVVALLPVLAFLALWRFVPDTDRHALAKRGRPALSDARLRRPIGLAFVSMLSVSVAQISVGFYAIDRLGLAPEDGARAAGAALTCVGVALIVSQSLVRAVNWPPGRLIAIGGGVSALGFGAAALASTPVTLCACYFVAAAGMGWVWPSVSALAANAVEPHEQGAAAGAIATAQGLGSVIGPTAGTLIYAVDVAAPYAAVAVLLGLAALWPDRNAKRR